MSSFDGKFGLGLHNYGAIRSLRSACRSCCSAFFLMREFPGLARQFDKILVLNTGNRAFWPFSSYYLMINFEQVVSAIAGNVVEYVNRTRFLPLLKVQDVIDRFNSVSTKYSRLCEGFAAADLQSGSSGNPSYDWDSWVGKIRSAFQDGVPMDFLSTPLLAYTMVFGRKRGGREAEKRIEAVKRIFKEKTAEILKEDYPGGPNIVDPTWMTSANRAHQAYHLAFYQEKMGRAFGAGPTIIEWGGGYGNMARLMIRINPGATYIIIDLPELLSLQYVYLSSLLGEPALNCVGKDANIRQGKINLVPYSLVRKKLIPLRCDSFISTWALTESPFEAQELVAEMDFCGAKQVLLAYLKGDGNFFELKVSKLNLKEELAVLQPGHAYAFR